MDERMKHGKEKGKETIMVVKNILDNTYNDTLTKLSHLFVQRWWIQIFGQHFHWTGCGNSDRVRRIANKMRCDVSKSINLDRGGVFYMC